MVVRSTQTLPHFVHHVVASALVIAPNYNDPEKTKAGVAELPIWPQL